MKLERIVSGAQTGVDLAALDAALALGFSCGGWVPQGRFNEDGPIDMRYPVRETPGRRVAQRTEWNVRDSDATLILSRGPLAGGSGLTQRLAAEQEKPCLQIDLAVCAEDVALARILSWLEQIDGTILNVAGPRQSSDPQIYAIAYRVIVSVLQAQRRR